MFLGKEIQATSEDYLVRDGDARPRGGMVSGNGSKVACNWVVEVLLEVLVE